MHNDFLSDVSQVFVGCSYFIPDEDGYQMFVSWMKGKSLSDVLSILPDLCTGKYDYIASTS
jgi:hypothetical protein